MRPDIKDIAAMVMAQVLEKQAFIFADPAPASDAAIPPPPIWKASIEFSGPTSGRFAIMASDADCREMAANILGVEAAPGFGEGSETAKEALRETLNVVCGNFLTELAGSEPVFDLMIPVVEEATTKDWEAAAASPSSSALLKDKGVFLITVDLEE